MNTINKNSQIFNKAEKGSILLLTVLIFLTVGVMIISGISYFVTKDIRNFQSLLVAKQSYFVSEAGLEDVLYRMKKGITVDTTEVLTLASSTATTTIINVGDNKQVTTDSNSSGFQKHVRVSLIQGLGVAFNYGVQVGNGGLTLTGGSSVSGNVYANGSILGGAGVHISGSAIAASGNVSIFKDTSNETPTTPSSGISFNTSATVRDFAQSFIPATTSPISKISIYVKKVGSPGNFTVNLMTDNGGLPGTSFVTATLIATQVTTNYGWVDLTFVSNPTLTAGTTYWLEITGTTKKASTDYYTLGANYDYSGGQAKIGNLNTPSWGNTSPVGLDGYFRLYLGSTPSEIKGYEGDYLYVGTNASDIAWGNAITFIKPTGNIYCSTSSRVYGGKVCDAGSAAKGLPPPLPQPVSEANIDAWHEAATAGGTSTGNLIIGWAGGMLGPRIINGNLTINGGGTLTLTGTVWVKGTITVTGGGKVALAASYGPDSEVIIADKGVDISGNGSFSGSGTPGSYPVILSTSRCPADTLCATNNSAISLSGGAGAVVLTAPYGKVNIVGGSACKAITGDSLYVSGGGAINYESGISDIEFKSGPSGGWDILSWKEVE